MDFCRKVGICGKSEKNGFYIYIYIYIYNIPLYALIYINILFRSKTRDRGRIYELFNYGFLWKNGSIFHYMSLQEN